MTGIPTLIVAQELKSPIRKSMQRMRNRKDIILVDSLVVWGLRPNHLREDEIEAFIPFFFDCK